VVYSLASGLIVVGPSTYSQTKPEDRLQPTVFDHLAPPGSRTTLHGGQGWHGDEWIGVPSDASLWEVPPLY
jgi:hypothetical protein